MFRIMLSIVALAAVMIHLNAFTKIMKISMYVVIES